MSTLPSITITKHPGSIVELSGEFSHEAFATYEAKALANLQTVIEVQGFRKGHVPEDVARKHIPESAILEEMAHVALTDTYPRMLMEHKIDAIDRPIFTITKLAKGNPFGFSIKTAVLPEVTLPDYKKIAKTHTEIQEVVPVTEKEIDDAILNLRKMRAHAEHDHAGHDHDHEHDHSEEELPVVDDAFVQSLGDFKDVADFTEKLRKNLEDQRVREAEEKVRIKLMDELVEKTEMDIPQILIDAELDKMLFQMKADVSQAGLSFDDYLVHIKKTEDDLKKEWADDGKKRVSFQLIIQKISENEKLQPTDEEIEKDAAPLLAKYKDADPIRVRAYIDRMITNEKVFGFLLKK